jgi:uncharacterized protein YjiK
MHALATACLSLMMACSQASDSPGSRGLAGFPLDADSLQQWKLPGRLKEISGLALSPNDRLFAVGDEAAIIYELDYRQGNIIKTFALGDPVVRSDFEGIAFLHDKLYLVNSKGMIYETREGGDGDRMRYKKYKTSLGKRCEIEGLAQDVQAGTLLLACKKSHSKSADDGLFIFVWSPSTGELLDESEIAIPVRDIERKLGEKSINPSGIAIHPGTANLYAIAAKQRAIVEMKPNGELIDAIILPLADRHRQAEGIEITRDGELLLADEGGNKKARLGVYSPGHNRTTDQQ